MDSYSYHERKMEQKYYKYNIIKCHPNLLEEKLNEEGEKGWDFVSLVIEQSMIQKKITEFINAQPEIVTNYCLIFKKEYVAFPETTKLPAKIN
jgi:hypothetical protein